LELSGEHISYRSPELALAERAEELLTRTSTLIDEQLSETQDLLKAAPRLLASWSQGSREAHAPRSEILHGAFAPTDLWLRIAATRNLRTTDGILPDPSRIIAADRHSQHIWLDALAREGLHVRTILSSDSVTAPGAAEVISADIAAGAEFRMLPNPPSWLWIADDDTVGLPFRWGDSWPTSVFATTDPAVVTLVRWLYDRLWDEAVPVTAETHSWDAILALMSTGATLEAASHALGISARTGRRRIAAALEHFGTDGLFALGVAWQRAQQHA
ncbi:MAG: hypothetical protein GX862_05480, partial [Leucobacter sp.]|nr:hypothetical protein [Leucobacter sp.]